MAPLMKSAELAQQLGIEETVLSEWRSRGLGPAWLRLGIDGIRYLDRDVVRWIDEQKNALVPLVDVVECGRVDPLSESDEER